MSALIRKEVRLLLPSFVIGLLLTLVIWLLPNDPYGRSFSGWDEILAVIPFVVCPAMAVMMALSSFGHEMSGGTFSFLLAQPMARSRLWWTKTLVLAAALAVMLAVWLLSLNIHFREKLSLPESKEVSAYLGTVAVLFTLVTYSSALWTVLLFRQVAVAFWFTLISPMAVLASVAAAHNRLGKDKLEQVVMDVALVLGVYIVGGFLIAWRMFLRAQDTQWTGGAITLPRWRWSRTAVAAGGTRPARRPLRALFAKELQLHQSQLVIAGVLALLHLGVLGVRKFGGDWKTSGVMDVVVNLFWATWLVMPWLVGCAAVAEERKLGTLEAQLCLPARRRTQFIIKFVSTLLVAVLLGAVMPLLFEGTRILPDLNLDLSSYAFMSVEGSFIRLATLSEIVTALLPLLIFVSFSVGIAAVSFYASTFSRNTLQAIAPAVLGLLAVWFLWAAGSRPDQFILYPLWRGSLIYILGLPVMTLTVAALMYGNFKHVLVGWNVWRRNVLVLLVALAGVMTVTTAIYQRPWELFSPLEPAHGAARLNFSRPILLRSEGANLTALFPDGRSWAGRLEIFAPPNLLAMLAGDARVTQTNGTFIEGTNWAKIIRSHPSAVGIQKDGSLWVADPPPPQLRRKRWTRTSFKPESLHFVRLGLENDWKSAANQFGPVILLKTNGTLWRLGTNNMHRLEEWPGLLAFTPERLGADSDWADVVSEQGQVLFRKTDGRTWTSLQYGAADKSILELNGEVRLYRADHLSRLKLIKPTWAVSRRGHNFQVGVFDDGTFRVSAIWGQRGFEKLEILIGPDSDWRSVAGNYSGIVTLKADGTLWKWNFANDPVARPESAHATRLSKQSDWLALTSAMDGVVALAADGSLWFWRFDSPRYYSSTHEFGPLLAASRRPQLIGNIFASVGQ